MARVPWRPPASKNAKSMRYNSGAVVFPKHARRLPGMMQTANMEKQDSTAPGQVIAHTFGLFRESSGCTRLQQRGNSRVPAPCTLRLAVVPVPIDETDALKLGVGLGLLVYSADVGSPGAVESACLCLRALRPAPWRVFVHVGHADDLGKRTRKLASWYACAPASTGLLAPPRPCPVPSHPLACPLPPRPLARAPAIRLFRLFRFPANLRHAPARGRILLAQGGATRGFAPAKRHRAGRPANVQW